MGARIVAYSGIVGRSRGTRLERWQIRGSGKRASRAASTVGVVGREGTRDGQGFLPVFRVYGLGASAEGARIGLRGGHIHDNGVPGDPGKLHSISHLSYPGSTLTVVRHIIVIRT